jgi:hypothetical protein
MEESPMKIHFLDTPEHLQAGRDYEANCKVVIKSAEFPYIADQELLGRQELSGINNCMKCLAVSERFGGSRYLYGLVEGQLAMSEAREK